MMVHFWRVRKDGGISGPNSVVLESEIKEPKEITMDWRQLWEIMSAPDNVPIIALIPLLAFYIFLAWRQAHANDLLIEQLEGRRHAAKTHHRKAWPFKPPGKRKSTSGRSFSASNSWPRSSSPLF